jgi:DNA-binding MarR family transcriptional regulator
MDVTELDLRAVLPHLARLGSVLNRSRLVERAMERAGSDLDRPSISILTTLSQAGEPLRIGEIAARMRVAGPHVTRQVHLLERRGLVRRLADEHDRRARPIALTPEGAAVAERYVGAVLGTLDDALSGWSAQDRATFYRLLARFADDLAAHFATDDPDP